MGHGRSPGVDIAARRDHQFWLIEAKGTGKHYQARRNYFLGVLGTIIKRMDRMNQLYSVAFPDLHQYRNHWKKLPPFAKQRIGVSALFVRADGVVSEEY